jgi:hypothetical protein
MTSSLTRFDDIIDVLNDLKLPEDVEKYKALVDNSDLITEDDYWRELFYESPREEVMFWVNYIRRDFTIHDFWIIAMRGDNLHRGLADKIVDFNGFEDCLEEAFEGEYNTQLRSLLNSSNTPADVKKFIRANMKKK